MSKLLVCLLLLLGVSLTRGVEDVVAPEDEDDLVKSEVDVTLENGEKVHETSSTDRECHVQLMTAKFEDNTKNTLVNDLDDNKGLMLFSDNPEICYVRSLDRKKGSCRGGYDVSETEGSGSEKVTHYTDGEELQLTDLPANLQELCEGKTVIQLVEVTEEDKEEDAIRAELEDVLKGEEAEAMIRKKRSYKLTKVCSTRKEKVCRTNKTCRHCCNGWWTGKRCGNNCCTNHTSCKLEDVERCEWKQVYVG